MPKEIPRVADLSALIGRRAYWSPKLQGIGSVKVEVVITDIQVIFGVLHYTVVPVSGTGSTRVKDAIELIPDAQNRP